MRDVSSIRGSAVPRTCFGGGSTISMTPVRTGSAAYWSSSSTRRIAAGRSRPSRVGSLLLEREVVALDPGAEGEVHTPLDFAPDPDSLARRLFDEAMIEAHLDHLAAGQADDGGWTFNWLAWSPVAATEWRGSVTIDALRTLRANGRL